MILKYIYHSGFYIEIENSIIIFDYYKGEIPDIDRNKKLYIFSSHSHNDHYNKNIFNIFKDFDATFILSDDIKVGNIENREKSIFVSPDKEYQIGDLLVETLESTDEGVAFIVKAENKTIYHSGDLNWWTWYGFESEEEYESMTERFKKEIAKIEGMEIDLAMMVLDYRQKERYDWGMTYLLEKTKVKYVAPMHCWDRYEVIDRFKKDHKSLLKDTVVIDTNKIKNTGFEIE